MSAIHIVFNPDGPDFEFDGDLVAEERSVEGGRVRVYQTVSGKYVVHQVRNRMRTMPSLERSAIFDSAEEIADWLGYASYVKSIMDKLGCPLRVKVE